MGHMMDHPQKNGPFAGARQFLDHLLYLLIGVPVGVTYSVALALMLPGLALIPAWVGVPLALWALERARDFAAAERMLLSRLLRLHIPQADPVDYSEVYPAARLGAYLGSPATWRMLIYLTLRLPFSAAAGGLCLGLALIAGWLLLTPFTYPFAPLDLGFTVIDTLSKALLCALMGAGIAAFLPGISATVADLWADFAWVMLGEEKPKRIEKVVISMPR